MIDVTCPHCGKRYEFEHSRLGATETCSQCGSTFTVSLPDGQPGYAPPTVGPPQYYAPYYPPPPYAPYYYPRPPTSGNAVASLVLGIASIWLYFLGFILGPIAIYLANKATREIEAGAAGGEGCRAFFSSSCFSRFTWPTPIAPYFDFQRCTAASDTPCFRHVSATDWPPLIPPRILTICSSEYLFRFMIGYSRHITYNRLSHSTLYFFQGAGHLRAGPKIGECYNGLKMEISAMCPYLFTSAQAQVSTSDLAHAPVHRSDARGGTMSGVLPSLNLWLA